MLYSTITDKSGAEVALFIDYMLATQEDTEGLLPKDVKRVEYLDYPTDPRFQGKRHVVNFIMQKYEYGGYTKLTLGSTAINGYTGVANVFSKFAYKSIVFDIFARAYNFNVHHENLESTSVSCLSGSDGESYYVTRRELPASSHLKQGNYPVTFRATYSRNNLMLRNTLGFTQVSTPLSNSSGDLIYTPSIGADYSYERDTPGKTTSAIYNGYWYFSMPKGFSLSVNPTFSYTWSRYDSEYRTSFALPIVRNSKDNALEYKVDATVHKMLGERHSINFNIANGLISNDTRYRGSADYDEKFRVGYSYFMLGYNFQNNKVSVGVNAGYGWVCSKINGDRLTEAMPVISVNGRYAFNESSSISGAFSLASGTPEASEKTSGILQSNELLYVSGNSNLESYRHTTLFLSYDYVPSNSFSMSVYGKYFGAYDRTLQTYLPYNDGTAVLSTMINNGDFYDYTIGASVSVNLLNGNLQVQLSPEQTFYKSTGLYGRTYNPFNFNVYATYYIGSLYFTGYYNIGRRSLGQHTVNVFRERNYHSLTAGWGNSSWNVSLTASNFFNRGWKTSTSDFVSDIYSRHNINNGIANHAAVNLSVVYTFGYGKKIRRGDEVGAQTGASSAILK